MRAKLSYTKEFSETLRADPAAAAAGATLEGTILPQVEAIACHALLAAREQLADATPPGGAAGDDGRPYRCFHLFGFDFMVGASTLLL